MIETLHFIYPFVNSPLDYFNLLIDLWLLWSMLLIALMCNCLLKSLLWLLLDRKYLHRSRITESHGNSRFNFWETALLFPTATALFSIPPAMHKSSQSPHPHQYWLFSAFKNQNHSNDTSLWVWFILSWWLVMPSILSCFVLFFPFKYLLNLTFYMNLKQRKETYVSRKKYMTPSSRLQKLWKRIS